MGPTRGLSLRGSYIWLSGSLFHTKTSHFTFSDFILVLFICSMISFSVKENTGVSHFRSPWSNQYDPPLEDGTLPSEKLRKLEIEANSAFDQFREM